MGTFHEFLKLTRVDRYVLRRELIKLTKPLREGGSLTGHHRTDRRL